MLGNRLLWPGLIGVALAVGLGVQMGESAIGGINPIHFQGAAARPQGIDPAAPAPPASAYAQAYGWEQGNAARQADGGSFQDFDYVPQPVSVQRVAEPVWHDEAGPVTLAPWPPGRVSSHPEIERYADFPIEEKPAVQPAPDRIAAEQPTVERVVPEQPEPAPLVPTGK